MSIYAFIQSYRNKRFFKTVGDDIMRKTKSLIMFTVLLLVATKLMGTVMGTSGLALAEEIVQDVSSQASVAELKNSN